MTIKKDSKIYTVRENAKSWTIIRKAESVTINVNVSKIDCPTFEDLKTFIVQNDIF